MQGGEVGLSGRQATKLGIVTSELAANAMRHGALSTRQGQLAIAWRAIANGSRRLHIAWTESGLGGLTIPDKVGRGTQLLAGAVKNFHRVFDTGGMTCSFELDLGCDQAPRSCSSTGDSSPCVEGSAFDANEGGGWNATDLARQLRQSTARHRAS